MYMYIPARQTMQTRAQCCPDMRRGRRQRAQWHRRAPEGMRAVSSWESTSAASKACQQLVKQLVLEQLLALEQLLVSS